MQNRHSQNQCFRTNHDYRYAADDPSGVQNVLRHGHCTLKCEWIECRAAIYDLISMPILGRWPLSTLLSWMKFIHQVVEFHPPSGGISSTKWWNFIHPLQNIVRTGGGYHS